MVKNHKTVIRNLALISDGALSHLMRKKWGKIRLLYFYIQAIDEHSVYQLPFLFRNLDCFPCLCRACPHENGGAGLLFINRCNLLWIIWIIGGIDEQSK